MASRPNGESTEPNGEPVVTVSTAEPNAIFPCAPRERAQRIACSRPSYATDEAQTSRQTTQGNGHSTNVQLGTCPIARVGRAIGEKGEQRRRGGQSRGRGSDRRF